MTTKILKLYMDRELARAIKATGEGYEARVNAVLRDALAAGELDAPADNTPTPLDTVMGDALQRFAQQGRAAQAAVDEIIAAEQAKHERE